MASRRLRQGFSLLEVLVGVVIAALVFIPVSQLLVTGAVTTQHTEDYLRALSIAKSQIELLKHAAKINKYAVEKLITEHAASGGFGTFTVDDIYQVKTTVDPQFQASELADLKLGTGAAPTKDASLVYVKVNVDWKISGEDRSLELEALVDRAYY